MSFRPRRNFLERGVAWLIAWLTGRSIDPEEAQASNAEPEGHTSAKLERAYEQGFGDGYRLGYGDGRAAERGDGTMA